jgi:hypothetical protein
MQKRRKGMRGFYIGVALGLVLTTTGCLLGRGQEGSVSFAAAREVTVSIPVNLVTPADFTRDGAADLLVGHKNGDIAILLGGGNGAFGELGTARTNPLRTVIAGDFNGDTNTDAAWATRTIDLYLGNGTGNVFGSINIDFDTEAAATVDFNRDRFTDLVVVGGGSLTTQGVLGVLFTDTNGGQPTRRTYPVTQPTAVAIADFTGDGLFDIAVGDSSQATRRVIVFVAAPGGTWSQKETYTLGAGEIRGIAVSDFAGDRGLDLAVTGGPGKVEVLVGRGDGTFTMGESYTSDPGGGTAIQIIAVDLNRGGLADLVVLSQAANGQGTLTVLPRRTDTGFIDPVVLGRTDVGQAATTSVAVFDANNDGGPDIVLAAGGTKLSLFLATR